MCSLLAIVDDGLIPILSHVLWVGLIAFLFGLLFRPKLEIEASTPNMVHRGDPLEVTLRIWNRGNLPCFDLVLEWSSGHRGLSLDDCGELVFASIASGSSVTHKVQLQATERGEHALPSVILSSLFPLSLFRFISRHRISQKILVAPALRSSVRHAGQSSFSQMGDNPGEHRAMATSREASWQSASVLQASQVSFDYVGSREYQPGVAVRRWDYASWARLGKPAVREFSDEQASSMTILVDTLRFKGGRLDEIHERVLEAAACLYSLAHREGTDVRLRFVGSELGPDEVSTEGQSSRYVRTMRQLALETGAVVTADWESILGETASENGAARALGIVVRKDNAEAKQAIVNLNRLERSELIKVWEID